MNSRLIFLPTVFIALIALVLWWQFRTADFGYIMASVGVANLGAAWWIVRQRRDWWSFAIIPAFILWSGFSYALVVTNQYLALASVLISALLSILYWRLVFLYIFNQLAYRPFSLERLFGYVSFATVFFSISSAYALKTFLDWPTWQPGVVILIVIMGLSYQWQWINKIEWKLAWPYVAFFPIAITELFFVLAFLPLDFNVSGFLIGSSWYALSQLASANISGKLNPQRIRLAGLGLILIWVSLLLTARWF